MEFKQVLKTDLRSVQKIYKSYVSSFPENERRNDIQYGVLFEHPKVEVLMIVEEGEEVGYLIIWKLTECFYIEHFEIFNDFRNGGLGGKVLRNLQTFYSKLILESEPETLDTIAARRIQFYLRNGFHVVDRDYIQPPYEKDKEWIPLWLLSNFEIVDRKQCIAELYQFVYRQQN